MNLLITAGIPHDKIDELQERYNENFRRYVKAELLFLDWHRKEKILWKRNYRSPSENRNPAMMFKGGQRSGKRINVVTNSEIVIYESDSWNIKQVISHPHFNDLHSVMYSKKLYWVANTGLEIVQAVNNEGEIIEEYPTDKPYLSCLIFGKTSKGDPVHSVWGCNEKNNWVVLITVYRPDPERWINWRKRRRKDDPI